MAGGSVWGSIKRKGTVAWASRQKAHGSNLMTHVSRLPGHNMGSSGEVRTRRWRLNLRRRSTALLALLLELTMLTTGSAV